MSKSSKKKRPLKSWIKELYDNKYPLLIIKTKTDDELRELKIKQFVTDHFWTVGNLSLKECKDKIWVHNEIVRVLPWEERRDGENWIKYFYKGKNVIQAVKFFNCVKEISGIKYKFMFELKWQDWKSFVKYEIRNVFNS